MNSDIKINCIILASGYSKRFPGNKLLTDFNNKPLIEWILQASQNIYDELIVVSRYSEIKNICSKFNTKCIIHNKIYKSDTIKIGVKNLTNPNWPCTFIAADQPFLTYKTLLNMRKFFETSPNNIVRLSWKNNYATPVIFPKWAINSLKKLKGQNGGKKIILQNLNKVKNFEILNKLELMDIDTIEDIKILTNN